MKETLYHVTLLLVIVMLFAGCNGGDNDDNKASAAEKDTKESGDIERKRMKLEVEQYQMERDEGMSDIHDCTSDSDNMYFIEDKYSDYGEGSVYGHIASVDLKSKEKEILYSSPDEVFYMSELCCTDGYLFWVYRKDAAEKIMMLNLESKEVSTIKEFPYSHSLRLNSDNRYVTWYEKNNDSAALFFHDTDTGKTVEHMRCPASESLVERAPVNDGIISYLYEDEKGKSLIAYSIKDDRKLKSIPVTADMNPTVIAANADYFVWFNGRYNFPDENDAIKCAYMDSDKTVTVNILKDIHAMYSFTLCGDYVMVIYKIYEEGRNELGIVGCDLSNMTKIDLYGTNNEDLVQGRVNPDGNFLCIEKVKGERRLLLVKEK